MTKVSETRSALRRIVLTKAAAPAQPAVKPPAAPAPSPASTNRPPVTMSNPIATLKAGLKRDAGDVKWLFNQVASRVKPMFGAAVGK